MRVLALVSSLGFLTGAYSSTTINWKPPVGAVYRFKWTLSSDDYPGANGVASIRVETTDTDSVKMIRSDGSLVVEVKISDVKASMDGKAISSKAASVVTETFNYKPNGEVITRETDSLADVDNPRLGNVERLIYPDHPTNIGDTWQYHEPANKPKGIFESKTTYTFVGREKIGDLPAVRIGIEYEELGTLLSAHAKGDIWISPDDGEIIKKDIRVDNFTSPQSAVPFKLHIAVERVGDPIGPSSGLKTGATPSIP